MTNQTGANVETVRRGYAAFNAGDLESLAELFHENASWHIPGRSALSGSRKGREAVFGQFGRYGGDTAGTFKAELQGVGETDDGRVVAIHRNTATRNGKQVDITGCLVFEFKDGKIISGTEFPFDVHAWDAFWS